MSTVPSGTRFIGISENVNLTERKSAVLNAETQPYTIQDLVDTIGTGAQGPQGVQGPAGPIGPVGPAGLNWQGSWVSGTSYVADDAVGYDGASWFCILATSGTTAPDVDTTHWALLASQGAQGPQGVQGPTGPQGASGGAGTLQQAFDNGNTMVSGNFKTGIFNLTTGVSVENTSTLSKATLETTKITLTKNATGLKTTNILQAVTPTANRTIYFPDADGTVALVDYKVYSALISQSGTGAPTAKVLKNTTGATFSFTRGGTGSFTVTASSNVFTTNKTASLYSLNTGGGYSNAMMNFWYAGATIFFIETLSAGSLTDGIMIDTFIEVRIYN
jgi:hypothetical protein